MWVSKKIKGGKSKEIRGNQKGGSRTIGKKRKGNLLINGSLKKEFNNQKLYKIIQRN
jgi:hypothetical protein